MTDQTSEPAIVTQAGALILGRRFVEAKTLLQNALRNAPDDAELHYLLGVAAYRSDDQDVAAREFELAVRADPRHVDATLGLGLVARDAGRLGAARSAFQAVLELEPANASAQRHLRELDESPARQAAPTVAGDRPPTVTPQPDGSTKVRGASPTTFDPDVTTLAELLDQRGRTRPEPAQLAGPILWHGQPSLRSLLGGFVWAAALLLLPRLVYSATDALPAGPARDVAAALWRVVAAVSWPLAVLVVVVTAATRLTRRYVVRKHRVEVYSGLMKRDHVALWLHDLERPVLVKQTLWWLVIGLASVEVDSTMLPARRGRRRAGRPGRILLSGLPLGVAQELAETLRAESLWQRRRMVQNFVSSR